PIRRVSRNAGSRSSATTTSRAIDRPLLPIQVLPDLGVAAVDIGAELQPAVELRERGLVHHEYRHGLRHGASVGVAGRDLLIDCLERLLHQQSSQLLRILHPDASMTDAAAVAEEQVSCRGIMQINVEPVGQLEQKMSEP